MACLFILLMLSCAGQKFLVLIKSSINFFLSWIILLMLYRKTHHQIQGPTDFLLFASRSFTILYFTLHCIIHFELIFVKHGKSMSRFIFFAYKCPIFHASFVLKTILFPKVFMLWKQVWIYYSSHLFNTNGNILIVLHFSLFT